MEKIILDCDPGHDDAMALLLAAKHCELLGVTVVSGNQVLDKVTRNALKVLELAGLGHLPVYAGADRPLAEPVRHGGHIHGDSGLDGPALPEPTLRPQPGHAVDFIVETVMAQEGVTLVPTGPLTNVALALRREPRLAGRLRQISLMGGSTTFGNRTPVAEFNIWHDPEAAHIVFESGVPIKMVGLNLTHQAIVGAAEIARMRALGNRTGQVAAELMEFFGARYYQVYGLVGAPLHDPCAVAWLVDPTLIAARPMHVAVELRGQLTRGMTVCDYRHLGLGADVAGRETTPRGEPPNTEVALRIDAPRFFDLLIGTLAQYP